VDVGAEAVHLPQLFKSVEEVVLPAPAREEVAKGVEGASQVVKQVRGLVMLDGTLVRRYAPKSIVGVVDAWREGWTRERVSKAVEGCVPGRELDVLVLEGGPFSSCFANTVCLVRNI
jgi:nucleoporin NDC1